MSDEMIEAEIARLTADNCRLVDEREGWKKRAEALATALESAAQRMTIDRFRLTEERDAARAEANNWKEQVQLLTAENCRLVAQRDEAHSEWATQLEAKRVTIAQRDAAQENCRKLHAENEGLRADALAYPPQRLDLQQYVTLKADYDRQVIMIETLQEGLKRTETLLAKAQGQHIDDRLKGFLAVISQLADQAQDLLP